MPHPADPRALTLTMPSRFETLQAVRSELRSWLRANRVEQEAADDILLAAWEACANAIEHPLQPAGATYALEAHASDGTVRVTVRDEGGWRAPVHDRAFRGLGLRLVHAVMDAVSIRRSREGTQVTMCRTAPTR